MSTLEQKTILLVEDEAIIAMSGRLTVQQLGYNVVVAHSGQKAVELALDDHRIALALMDIDLGKGIDGTEAARQILAYRNIPIVFLTSHSEREMVEKVRGITRYGYLIKNSGDFVLQSSIEMAFELWEAHEMLKRENLERRQAQSILREREVMLNGILDNSPYGIWMQNKEGRLLFVNKSYCDAIGISEERFLSVPHYAELYDKSTAESCMKSDRVALAQKHPHVSYEDLLFTDGNMHTMELVKTRMIDHDGRLQGLVCVAGDVTERKKTEQALMETRLTYRVVAENTFDWEFWLQPDGTFKYVSPSCERITGYTETDFLNDPRLMERILHPEDADFVRAHIDEVVHGKVDDHEFNFRVIHRNGEIRRVNHHCHAVFDADGQWLGVRGSNCDITQREISA